MIPSLSTAKLIGIGLGALALIGFLAWVNSIRTERNELKQWRDGIVAVVQSEVTVERRKSVKPGTVADEVRWLGREYRTHRQALEIQSQKLLVAKQRTEGAVNAASVAAKRALDADKARKVARDRLTAPTRSHGLSSEEWQSL